jgi:hypothetical protein
VAAQLAASQEGLSSASKQVSVLKRQKNEILILDRRSLKTKKGRKKDSLEEKQINKQQNGREEEKIE